jgi:hypothetical protein
MQIVFLDSYVVYLQNTCATNSKQESSSWEADSLSDGQEIPRLKLQG